MLEAIEAHTAALVGGEVGRLLARCGLAEVVERLRLYQQAQEAEAQVRQRARGRGGAATPSSA